MYKKVHSLPKAGFEPAFLLFRPSNFIVPAGHDSCVGMNLSSIKGFLKQRAITTPPGLYCKCQGNRNLYGLAGW